VFGQHSAELAICCLGVLYIRSRLHAYIPRRKRTRVTYSECVSVALVIQHATLMRRFTLSSMFCPALPYFPHYLINGTIHGGQKVIRHELCGLISLHVL